MSRISAALPNVGGLSYFAERFLAAGAPTDIVEMSKAYNTNPNARALIDVFSGSQESKDLYPGDNGAFVDASTATCSGARLMRPARHSGLTCSISGR